MKRVLFFVLCLLISYVGLGQFSFNVPQSLFLTLNSQQPSLVFDSQAISRYNLYSYTNFKFHNIQVISAHQPYTPFDYVYFVDKSGNTLHRNLALTSPLNTDYNFEKRHDSLNPHGSTNLGDAIILGGLNSILSLPEGLNKLKNLGLW
ncbi:MAG: hypothetical protein AAGI07_12380 [Bacteroidota bacterium]